MPTVTSSAAAVRAAAPSRVRPRVTEEEFLDLICQDEELLRAEFDALVAASWQPPPPPPPAPPEPVGRPPSWPAPPMWEPSPLPAGPARSPTPSRRQRGPPPRRRH